MMTSVGHQVFLYAGTQNEAEVTEFVSVVNEDDHKRWFGHYNWNKNVFGDWDANSECWKVMNARVATEINKRKQPGDIIGIIGGLCQKDIMTAVPDLRAVEWGIGYEGIIDQNCHVFESNAWMHYVYGIRGIKDGRHFDTVIPNSFDEE